MDAFIHGLASLALQRAFFPRAAWRTIFAIIFAGVIADIDWFTAGFGPGAYLHWHRTATHSIAFVVLLAILALLFSRTLRTDQRSSAWLGFAWLPIAAAATLHILMDLLQADAFTPFWPFSAKTFSFDVAPFIDPWLIVILVAAILFPELVRLVSDEIGARAKRPRGRNGAIAGLFFALFYFGLRALFHGNAIASLEARTIAGEMPRRVAAFPDSASPFLWHSVVETESALHLTTMRSMGGEVSYAAGITTLRKPEPSAILSAAQSSPAAITFLKSARFPKATVQKETEGYSVEIQDLKNQATEEKNRTIFAEVNLDENERVVSAELQWQKPSPRP